MKVKAPVISQLLRRKSHNCIWIFLILFSCLHKPSRKEEVEQYLTGGGTKYWLAIPDYPQRRFQGYSYHSNGTYTYYIHPFEEPQKRIIGALNHSATWKLINDSIIDDGQGIKLRIDYINEDVLILSNISFKGTTVCLKAKDQETVPVKDTTNYQNNM